MSTPLLENPWSRAYMVAASFRIGIASAKLMIYPDIHLRDCWNLKKNIFLMKAKWTFQILPKQPKNWEVGTQDWRRTRD